MTDSDIDKRQPEAQGDGGANTSGHAPDHWPAKPLGVWKEEWAGMRANLINPAQAWTSPVVFDWELRAAGWQDLHQYDELNYIIDGELHVECNGHEIVAGKGDLVRVPGGSTGRYWAPDYAHMVSLYGPNPDGSETEKAEYWDIHPVSIPQ